MNKRAYYFGAGPAAIPLPVLEKTQAELLNWQQTGVSILEHGHRTTEFKSLLSQTEDKIRSLLKVPLEYKIIFTGGNTRSLFATIPMNFYQVDNCAAYYISGVWSKMAYTHCVQKNCLYQYQNTLIPDTKFLYYVPNETVNGIYTRKNELPNVQWLIADMTSCLFMEPIDFSNYGVIFAGTQKNLGNAGMQIIIVHEKLLNNIRNPLLPEAFNLKTLSDSQSLFATPPTFNCYLANLVLDWMAEHGDINYWKQQNLLKANLIYNAIDDLKVFSCSVKVPKRSTINVCFDTLDPELTTVFLEQARKANLIGLKGHSSVGGLRASIYNAVSIEAVNFLVEFMYDFAKKHE